MDFRNETEKSTYEAVTGRNNLWGKSGHILFPTVYTAY